MVLLLAAVGVALVALGALILLQRVVLGAVRGDEPPRQRAACGLERLRHELAWSRKSQCSESASTS